MRKKINLSVSEDRNDIQELSNPKKKSKKEQTSSINFLTGKPYSSKYYEILEVRQKLPAHGTKDKLIKMVQNNQVIIVVGETGSGKTTQVPQFLLEAGMAKEGQGIVCTQPRRVAAMSVSQRVAQELDVELGQEVGYSVRFEDHSSENTVLKYVTDGMLLREAMMDHTLSKYSVIILDEAHERTLNTDILFGLIKELLPKRPELKLIVMSATLDAEKFQEYFNEAPRVDIPGRTYPVEVYFSQAPESDYVQASIEMAVDIHRFEPEGDILIFLTGEEEIETACAKIEELIEELGDSVGLASVIPLYSTLPPHLQQRIFEDPPRTRNGKKGRKIIVATNIAETSITIDGIVYVVDPGFSKQKVYNPRMRVESLLVSPISKASAKQRAGRAGRTRPGKCFRLYTEASYKNELIDNTYPEILRSNLASTILMLKRLGVEDLVHFDFMDPPSPETLMRALDLLNHLGAIDEEGELTEDGKKMSEFPLDPQLSRILLSSVDFDCVEEMITIVSCMSSPNIFLRPKDKMAKATDAHSKFISPHGDHITVMIAFHEYKKKNMDVAWCSKNFLNHRHLKAVDDVREQLKKLMIRVGIDIQDKIAPKFEPIAIKKCILKGYFPHVAVLQKNNVYLTLKDSQVVDIHPSCVLKFKPLFVMYHELVLTKKNYMRTVTDVKPEWLFETDFEYFNPETIKNTDIRKALEKALKEYQSSSKKNKVK